MTRRLIKEYDLTRAFADRSSVLSPNNYSIESANNLRLWAKMTAGAPTDLGLCNLSPSYDNNASVSNALIGNRVYSALNCSDSAGQRAQVTATNGALSFSTVASGVAPTAASDLPFSISCWINVTSLSSTVHIFGKDGGTGTDVEYKARVYSTGAVNFELHDEDAGGAVYEGVGTPSSTITTNQWYHVVFTYDGRGGASANAGMNIYVDGVKKNSSTTTGGVYVGMQPFHDLPLYIGADGDTSDEMDGQIAEFAVWGVELSLEEINAIYSSTREDSYAELSGIISNPARVRQQIKDSYTGSYPPVLPTGNPDYTGNNLSIFDDTDTIIFQGGNTVYPTNLPAGSKFLSGGVATPNILEGITTAGTASAGIFDSNITIFAGPTGSTTFGPFVEDRTYLDNDADFYATGTASGTLPGFDQRLSSKIAIVLDTNPRQATSFFFSTGTAPNASGYDAGVNTGMGYYNWTDKKWEIIGNLSSGSNIDLLNIDESTRKKGLLGFCPSNLANVTSEHVTTLAESNAESVLETVGSPTSEYGFPFASKYDATGSQTLDMSKYINEPFLLEKATIEFSGTFGPHIVASTQFGPVVKTFFLMTQKDVSGSASPFKTDILTGTSVPGQTIFRSYDHGYSKSLVAYGQASLITNTSPTSYNRDLSITSTRTGVTFEPITGSYKLEFLPKSVQKNSVGGFSCYNTNETRTNSENREVLKIHGGRSGFDLSDGRSFIAGVGGLTPSGSYTFELFRKIGSTDLLTVIANKKDSIARTSPYVLLPTDKLIFGFASTPNWRAITQNPLSGFTNGRYESGLAMEEVILSPGSGKVTLYGTLLRDNLPAEGNSNEYLTSDAIHEDIRSDIPVYDQWDVEPFNTLTGSYVDNILTGSMFGGTNAGFNQEFADGTAAGVRMVVSSVAAGHAGVTGSLQRFVRLTDKNEKAYDSYPPNPVDVLNKEGVGILSLGASLGIIAVGVTGNQIAHNAGLGVDSSWYMRSAYEVSSARFIDSSFQGHEAEGYNTSGVSQGKTKVGYSNTAYIMPDDLNETTWRFFLAADSNGSFETRESLKNAKKFFWGFGDRAKNVPDILSSSNAVGGGAYATPLIRGYKYGLMGIFGSSVDARFRRDKFGQFRDMLEQRKFLASIDSKDKSREFPLTIRFTPRSGVGTTAPNQTHSQNLSHFSTSSLPYYDGLAVDRSDDPDVTLKPIDIDFDITVT